MGWGLRAGGWVLFVRFLHSLREEIVDGLFGLVKFCYVVVFGLHLFDFAVLQLFVALRLGFVVLL